MITITVMHHCIEWQLTPVLPASVLDNAHFVFCINASTDTGGVFLNCSATCQQHYCWNDGQKVRTNIFFSANYAKCISPFQATCTNYCIPYQVSCHRNSWMTLQSLLPSVTHGEVVHPLLNGTAKLPSLHDLQVPWTCWSEIFHLCGNILASKNPFLSRDTHTNHKPINYHHHYNHKPVRPGNEYFLISVKHIHIISKSTACSQTHKLWVPSLQLRFSYCEAACYATYSNNIVTGISQSVSHQLYMIRWALHLHCENVNCFWTTTGHVT